MLVIATLLAASSSAVFAGTTTTTFTTQINIQPTCIIGSAGNIDFGNQGVLSANVDQFSDIVVQCTATTTYNVGLNAGTGVGATVAVRKLTSGGGATINYSLYSDGPHTTVWGNTVGTDTVPGLGDGTPKSHRVFGRVPPQTTPAPALYNDTITVTVTY
ncbi:MAG: hypothetical protein QOF19_3510 [Alphaproteobacteria bacterium]|jgi:spore coat protein U-like protein|nr:hypothetical protein [Alphaproteobacteria bacterium]MEA2977990.1 hypothetical protein [Alphaproteobacteria bacterium]